MDQQKKKSDLNEDDKQLKSPSQPIIKASHDDESDYSDFDDDEQQQKQKDNANAQRKILEVKQQVKQILDQKAATGGFLGGDDDEDAYGQNEELDALWLRVKDGLQDLTDNGSKKELTAKDKPTKLRFLEACNMYDPQKSGQITIKELQQAFTLARLQPPITDQECERLITALDAWYQKEAKTVLYGRLLDGSRQSKSIHGIFPKHQIRGPSKYEKEKKEKDEEEQRKKAQAEEEEKQKREALMQKKKIDAANEKNKSSKEDLKRLQKDDQIQKEAERKEAERLQKIEDEIVKKEVGKLKTIVESVRSKLTKGSQDMRKWFNLSYDNRKSRLDKLEIIEVLNQAGTKVLDKELETIIDLLDNIGDRKISYQELCDILEEIKVPNYQQFVIQQRATQKKLQQENIKNEFSKINIPSKIGVFDDESDIQNRDNNLGRVDGLSQILGKAVDKKTPPKLIDNEQDILRIKDEIKEILRADLPDGKPTTFDDLLALMGKPTFRKEGQVFLKDFERLIRAREGDNQKFSAFEIKLVFNEYSIHKKLDPVVAKLNLDDGPYIPLRDFKDKFLPQLNWKKDDAKEFEQEKNQNQSGADSISMTESMVIDNILEGKKAADVAREKHERERILEKQQNQRIQTMTKAPSSLKQDYDDMSVNSVVSKPIDNVVQNSSKDPRKKIALRQGSKQLANQKTGSLTEASLKKLAQQQKVNDSFYRQPQAAFTREVYDLKAASFDQSLEKFFKLICNSLIEELKNGPKSKEIDSYIDHYGKQYPGFLTFQEFKEIYNLHIIPYDSKLQPAEQGKLLAVFNLFDVQSRGRISRTDFVDTVSKGKPVISIIERISQKIKKGGDRFIRAISEEFQEADAPFGCNGLLPLNNFQVIMADYDLPLLQSDLTYLEKAGFVTKSTPDRGSFVEYNLILQKINQKQQNFSAESGLLLKAVIRIQSNWRGKKGREEAEKRRAILGQDAQQITDQIQGKKPTGDLRKGKKEDPKQIQKQVTKKDQVKKKDVGRAGKKNQKEVETIEQKIAGIIRPAKESRINDKLVQQRKDMGQFIKTVIIDHIIESAFCYGESLLLCRTIQKKFETRPVTKYLFPLTQSFKFALQGALPRSLQTINNLGQLICLDSENQLNQYDIAANKSLQSVNFSQKPPVKNCYIIDLIIDQASGRIYTLNSNWILEIWSIEQNISAPQERLSVCANEGGKDFINLYYKQTFNNSKPRFLSLQQSNQQILVVNTTCVDGSIVFIDPISFSVLKKMQLCFSDYEIPKAIRQSINTLRQIFDKIQENQGKDIMAIFSDITDTVTMEVSIKNFVKKLCHLESSLNEEDLYKCCQVLDKDSCGHISLDDFLEFFGSVQKANQDMKSAEDELEDEMWPDWLIKEGKLQYAKNLLVNLHNVLDQEHGIKAEQAFSIYDLNDTGECTLEEFKRILKIFFSEVVTDESDFDFLIRLTVKRQNRVDYRDFCKYLSKRVVRAFKIQGQSQDENTKKSKKDQKNDLEAPLTKQASLSYILKKASELDIDLRKIIVEFDKNELNVIPKPRFIDLILDLPLGLNEIDIQEILENDLHFDTYGNVDYTVILNSDLFCNLERQRLQNTNKRRRAVQVGNDEDGTISPRGQAEKNKAEVSNVDNRKVVVEDLIFIDDLEIIVYTVVAPVTSQIFISSVKKSENSDLKKQQDDNILTLEKIKGKQKVEETKKSSQNLQQNYYQILAKLKGHQNNDPPSICYVPQSCCLISGEKNLSEQPFQSDKSTFPTTTDPTVPSSHKFQKSNQDAYQKHQANGQNQAQFEILIWNLQRDMIELFSSRPPWFIPCHKKINAHNSSIIDICYLAKSQLIVTSSTDNTIKFFDPISKSYELVEESNNPHAQMRPGFYNPLKKEVTRSNITFKEVKRIYSGNDTQCFALRSLHIQNIIIDPQNPEIKSQIEWLVALNLGRPSYLQGRNTQVSYIQGYAIERVQIEVPAIHHDDIVPSFVLKECEELVSSRRRKLVSQFQQGLQQKISRIFAQVQLQESFIQKIRKLFMEAILQRKELRYVNPDPLREIYKLILSLPDRTKYQSFLASSGCRDKLSVSETFFYLQKFKQIHPLRTTQIEFEKSIQEFHDKHQRQFLKGAKRWPKKGLQRFADHIRANGLDLLYLQTDSNLDKRFSSFCTRERLIKYFEDVVKVRGDHFNELEIESILNDLDPFFTGVIQLRLMLKIYQEELHHFKLTSFNRPKEIIEDIRTAVFPNKRIILQQALASADTEGDGFLLKPQFLKAFEKAKIKIDRDTLSFLFDIMSENYTLPKTEFELETQKPDFQNRVLKLRFFIQKLFQKNETMEVDEIEQTLSSIKSALVYKGLDFSIMFAEESEEKQKAPRRQAQKRSKEERLQKEKEKAEEKKRKEQNKNFDSECTTCHT